MTLINLSEFNASVAEGGYAGTKEMTNATVLLCLSFLFNASSANHWQGEGFNITPDEQDTIDDIVAQAISQLMENVNMPQQDTLHFHPFMFEFIQGTWLKVANPAYGNGYYIFNSSNAQFDSIRAPLFLSAGDYTIIHVFQKYSTAGQMRTKLINSSVDFLTLDTINCYNATSQIGQIYAEDVTLANDYDGHIAIETLTGTGGASITLQDIFIAKR